MEKFVKRLSLLILSLAVVLNIFNVSCDAVTKKKKNLFFTYSNLSYLCATAIALCKPNEVNDVVITPPSYKDSTIIERLHKVFNRVYVKNDFGFLNSCEGFSTNYDCVFSACAATADNVIFRANVNNGALGVIYDEGTSSYVRLFPLTCENFSKRSFLLFPKYRVGPIKNFPSEQIPREKFLEAIKLLYEPKPIKTDVIFSLAESRAPTFNAKLNSNIFNILKSFDGLTVSLKCHPYEQKKFLLPKQATEINRLQPFEKFYYGFNGILISNLSSTVLTAKFMQPKSTVICTAYLDGEEIDKKWIPHIKMLKELGVLFPKTLAELKSMISQNINKI